MVKKNSKEPKDSESESKEEQKDNKITRQIQVQKLHFNLLMSTEDPNETIDYLCQKAKELIDCHSAV